MSYELVIGDKNYSSWSLRPWLAMTVFEIPFREISVSLRQPDTREQISPHSPSGLVPVLKAGALTIWDSLAIMEFLAERHPDRPFWPAEADARAVARAASSEMHSGFYPLRKEMPMDLLTTYPTPAIDGPLAENIRRIVALWRECRRRFGAGGAFLFGGFSIADAMFAPVVTRFRTYGVDLADFGDDGTACAYGQAVLALPAMAEWASGAQASWPEGPK